MQLFYPTGNVGVLFNPATREQKFIQGIMNHINATAISLDRKFIAFADIGEGCALMLWDVAESQVLRVWLNLDVSGISSLSFSPTSDLIAALSAGKDDFDCQIVSLWRFTEDSPVASVCFHSSKLHTLIRFNPGNPSEFLTSSDIEVFFWHVDAGQPRNYMPARIEADNYKRLIGKLTQSAFLPHCAVTATVEGDIIVWETVSLSEAASFLNERQATKLVRVCHGCSPTVVEVCQDKLALGCDDGGVRIFDENLRLLYWFEKIGLGPIRGLSFKSGDPSSFIFSTARAVIANFRGADCEPEVMVTGLISPIIDIATMPGENHIAVGAETELHFWDFANHELIFNKSFTDLRAISMTASASFIAVGFSNGSIALFDKSGYQVAFLKGAPGAVTQLAFHPETEKSLVASVGGAVRLIREVRTDEWVGLWELEIHSKPIISLAWFSGSKIVTLSEDKHLAEIDITESSGHFIHKSRATWDSSPLGMTIRGKHIDVFDDEYKLRTFCFLRGHLKCIQVRLGPTFYTSSGLIAGSPVNRVSGSDRFLSFASGGIVGVWRDTGEFFGVTAGPKNSRSKVSASADNLFSGGDHSVVKCYRIDLSDRSTDLFVNRMSPELAIAAREIFCLCQIRNKGEKSILSRKIDSMLPVELLEEALTGLGYFPSQQDLDCMKEEVEGQFVSFETFSRMFMNYRPFSTNLSKMERAIGVINNHNSSAGGLLLPADGRFDSQADASQAIELLNTIDSGHVIDN